MEEERCDFTAEKVSDKDSSKELHLSRSSSKSLEKDQSSTVKPQTPKMIEEETKSPPKSPKNIESSPEFQNLKSENPIVSAVALSDPISETRIKSISTPPKIDHQQSCPQKAASSSSFSNDYDDNDQNEIPEKEGEGDVLDTITPLEVLDFDNRVKRKQKNFSESNHGHL